MTPVRVVFGVLSAATISCLGVVEMNARAIASAIHVSPADENQPLAVVGKTSSHFAIVLEGDAIPREGQAEGQCDQKDGTPEDTTTVSRAHSVLDFSSG